MKVIDTGVTKFNNHQIFIGAQIDGSVSYTILTPEKQVLQRKGFSSSITAMEAAKDFLREL